MVAGFLRSSYQRAVNILLLLSSQWNAAAADSGRAPCQPVLAADAQRRFRARVLVDDPLPGGSSLVAATATPAESASSWRQAVTSWAERHVGAAWFPWVLAAVGFADYFMLGAIGFILTPMLTIGMLASSPRRALLLIALLSAGCFAGSLAFSQCVGQLGVAERLAGTPQLQAARDLLLRHGVLAGALNTIFPLPTIPLIVATHAVEGQVLLILLAMAAGRLLRWSVMFATIQSSKAAVRSFGGDAPKPKDSD